MSGEDGSNCLICHEPFLASAVGALKCGHTYHQNCVVIWLSQNKSAGCPLCKTKCKSSEMRTLDFHVKQTPTQSPEELRRLEAATLEERQRKVDELTAKRAEVAAATLENDAELGGVCEIVMHYKRQRREHEQGSCVHKLEYARHSDELLEATKTVCAIRAGLDAEASRLLRKLPIKQPREGDPDLHEVRRKLRGGLRPAEQTRQLHEALYSVLQQESEKMRDKNQREAANKRAEDELRDLRHHEVQGRRELDDLRSNADHVASSQISSQASNVPPPASQSSSSSTISAPPRPGSAGSGATAPCPQAPTVEVVTPHGVTGLPVDDDDEDVNMLYGGAPSRRPAISARSILSSAVPRLRLLGSPGPASTPAAAAASGPGGAKWGTLFGGRGSSASAGQVAEKKAAQPLGPQLLQPEKSSMKSLFANRRA